MAIVAIPMSLKFKFGYTANTVNAVGASRSVFKRALSLKSDILFV